jgi:outer membrane protein
MKNGLLIWNVVLTLVVGYLLITHFTGKKENKAASKTASSSDVPSSPGSFRIAYFVQDSVESSYTMIKEVVAEMEKKEVEFNNNVAGLQTQFRRKEQELQEKGVSMEQGRAELTDLNNRLSARRQELEMEYQNFVTTKNIAVKKSVLEFLNKYNQDKKYAYILSYDESGAFYYKDSAFDITADIVAGLNEEYSKKPKEKAK